MARRASAGRSGARMGQEKRAAGKGSRDMGEPAGQMKQKNVAISPERRSDAVKARRQVRSPVKPKGR